MLDQISLLESVAGRLESAGIPYMLTGSIAASHYGRPRFTRDIDLVVELGPDDAGRIEGVLGHEFTMNTDGIRAAILRRGMFNVIHSSALIKIDFIIRKDSSYRVEEFQRRQRVRLGDGAEIWMTTAEDLILSKLLWAKDSRSELQLTDVRSVLRIQEGAIDSVYLEDWAKRLTVADLLHEVR